MIRTNRPIPAGSIKLAIFDLDGTLIDSRLDLSNAVNAMLRHLGHPELPCNVIQTYIGDGAPMLVRRALGDPDDEQHVQSALQYFLTWYREHKLDNTYVYAGVRQALERIRDARNGAGARQLAVLTNKPVRPSLDIVNGLGLADLFFRVYGGNSFPTKKPDPLGAKTLLQEAGVAANQAVIIGDSSNDVLTGQNCGIWTLGLTYGFAPHTLEDAPPDVLVDTPEEMAQVFAA